MITVYVKKKSNYPVSSPKMKNHLRDFLSQKGIVSDADVSLAFVGEKEMLELAKKYLKETNILHNVLSFPYSEGEGVGVDKKFLYPPDDTLHLGEIVICYPKVVDEAKKEDKLIDDRVLELVEHGALHLLGEHHK